MEQAKRGKLITVMRRPHLRTLDLSKVTHKNDHLSQYLTYLHSRVDLLEWRMKKLAGKLMKIEEIAKTS